MVLSMLTLVSSDVTGNEGFQSLRRYPIGPRQRSLGWHQREASQGCQGKEGQGGKLNNSSVTLQYIVES